MAKEYGIPIAPTLNTERAITEMAAHLNWSKSAVVSHCVNACFSDIMAHPKALMPREPS